MKRLAYPPVLSIRQPIRHSHCFWLMVFACQSIADATAQALEELTVTAVRAANTRPAGSFSTPVTALRIDNRVDVQPRGLPEGQADIAIRGGLFESTGFRLGAVSLFDPQTGHYVASLPINPRRLSAAEITTGLDHGLQAFNATVATVSYGFRPMTAGGSLTLGRGEYGLNYGALDVGTSQSLDRGDFFLGASLAGSKGDGTLPGGDHTFTRADLHGQWQTADSQTDLLLGYQDLFYGWPGAYTGFASLLETDDTQTQLILIDHQRDVDTAQFGLSAYWRSVRDDYDFDRATRETGVPGAFEHETVIWGVGTEMSVNRGDWRYVTTWQYAQDELVASTDLTAGDFTARHYLAGALLAARELPMLSGTAALKAGLRTDWTHRDGAKLAPIVGLTYSNVDNTAQYALDVTKTHQVPGYTALKSPEQGLFGGNPELGFETATQASVSYARQYGAGRVSIAGFLRKDQDLVDWTYSRAQPFSRQANSVDMTVGGIELLGSWNSRRLRITLGATFLTKQADYASADVNASFYALNYPERLLTAGIAWQATKQVSIHLDQAYRYQAENPLRNSSREAYYANLSVSWDASERATVSVVIDNMTDEDFEYFPGTPAVRRQGSVQVCWDF